jgi:SNF2 family DNA or RNA helicase
VAGLRAGPPRALSFLRKDFLLNGRWLSYKGPWLLLKFPYDQDLIHVSKSLGGHWLKSAGAWAFQPSQVLKVIAKFCILGEEIDKEVWKLAKEAEAVLAQRTAVVEAKKDPSKLVEQPLPDGFQFVSQPYAHQRTALALAARFNSFALLMEMGTGKSKVALDLFRMRVMLKQVDKLIIVCPKSVISSWEDEIAKHTKITSGRVLVMRDEYKRGRSRTRDAIFEDFLLRTDHRVLIVHYDLLRFLQIQATLAKATEASKRIQLIVDESTKIKTPSAQRTKETHALCRAIPYRLIMSGLPLPNSLEDIFGQFYAVDLGQALGTSFTRFRREYFFPVDRMGFKWVAKPDTKEFFSQLLEGQGYRCRKQSCLDLPPKVYEVRKVEMMDGQAKLYQQISEELIATIEKERVSCKIALTRLIKLAEIVSGHIIDDAGKAHDIQNPKLNALEELLDEIGDQKAVIFTVFRRTVEKVLQQPWARQRGVLALTGATSDDSGAIVKAFQEDPNCRLLIAHPATGGMGITLTSSKLVIYLQNDFNLENRLQSEDRCHRIGSEIHDKVTILDLIVPGTIDEVIWKALRRKDRIQKSVVDWRAVAAGTASPFER